MKTITFTLFLLWMALSASAAISVSSSFNPPSTTMGRSASYVITIEGATDVGDPGGQLPEVDGLRISSQASRSVQSSYSIINGRASRSYTVSLSYGVQPQREGSFTVPAWQIEIDGETYRVPPARLDVSPPGEAQKNAIALKIDLPDTLYVGQAYKTSLEVLLRSDVRVANLAPPERHGDGFLHSPMDQDNVQRSRQRRNGQIYEVFSWPVLITPIKDGELDLNYSMQLAAVIPDSGNDRGRSRSLFDDPFFAQPEHITVNSEAHTINVQPLPSEGKPEHFSGAIGQFEAQASIDSPSGQVGEPMALTLNLSGQGNFEQMQAPSVLADENWRVYPPKTEFIEGDAVGYEGVRRYDYLLVPMSEKLTSLPPLAINYFDPETKQYASLDVSLPEISVAPAASGSVRVSGGTLESAPQKSTRLLPLALTPGGMRDRLVPVLKTPLFWGVQAVPFLAFVGLFFWKRQQQQANAGGRERKQARNEALAELTEARKQRSDSARFYTHAENALQAAALCAGQTSRSRDSVQAAAQSQGLSTEPLTSLFHNSDSVRFGGLTVRSEAINQDLETLESIVKKLTSSR